MNVIFLVLSLLVPTVLTASHNNNEDATSKTFFSIPAAYSTGHPEHLTSYRDRRLARTDGYQASFQAVVFAGKTTDNAALARYFMPNWKTCALVAESPDPLAVDGSGVFLGGSDAFKGDVHDLLAHNFNIQTVGRNFKSLICLEPEHSCAGVAFNYQQHFFDTLWFDITAPVMYVRNALNLVEKVKTEGTAIPDHPKNMTEALQQSAWKFGKISPCALTKVGVADVELRLGYDSARREDSFYSSFVGLIIPTGNTPKAQYVFEPIIGRNQHWGLEWGASIGVRLLESDSFSTQIVIDTNAQYLFEHNELRSFDLRGKPWSRYINVFTDPKATTTSPGINLFTQCMKIRPRGSGHVNSAFIITYDNLDFELGLHTFYRQTEEGSLACPWQLGPAIAGVEGATSTAAAQSMSLATMRMWNYNVISQDVDYGRLRSNPANNDAVYKPIHESDLNLQSALHPSTLAYTLYAAVARRWLQREYPTLLNAGASYQFTADNTALSKWSAWFKISVSV